MTQQELLRRSTYLGINLGRMPKFVRNFMADAPGIAQALQAYVRAVKDGSFPDDALHAW